MPAPNVGGHLARRAGDRGVEVDTTPALDRLRGHDRDEVLQGSLLGVHLVTPPCPSCASEVNRCSARSWQVKSVQGVGFVRSSS